MVSAFFFSLSIEALKLGWRSSDKLGHIFSVDFFSVAGSVTNRRHVSHLIFPLRVGASSHEILRSKADMG